MNQKSLQVPNLPGTNKNTPIEDISLLLYKQENNPIDIEPWPTYPEYFDLPKVSFSIAHSENCIFVKYDVKEHEVLARYKQINDPVYKDSCVEFFIGFDDEKSYYNIEFNRLGTCLGRFGNGRENRIPLPVEVLKTIKYERTLKQLKDTGEPAINWTLTVAVPIEVFCFHKITSLQHTKSRMNFFKCGDDLSQPHYLAWNNIISTEPNFHLPEFFGEVEFL
jgi:hypothetical protein